MVAAALVFPFYVVWRYRYLRIHGPNERFVTIRRGFIMLGLILGAALYVLLGLSMFAPQGVPTFYRLAERGYLAFVVPLIFLDVILNAVLSAERALSGRR